MKGGPSGWVQVLSPPTPHHSPSDPRIFTKTQNVQKTQRSILKIPVIKPPKNEDNNKTRRQRKTGKNITVQKTKITSMFSSITSAEDSSNTTSTKNTLSAKNSPSIVLAKNSTVERKHSNIETVCEDTLHCPGSDNILHCPDSDNTGQKYRWSREGWRAVTWRKYMCTAQ